MRKLIFCVVFLLPTCFLQGQYSFGIQEIRVTNPNPTVNDSIEVRVVAIFPTVHNIELVKDTLIEDQLELEVSYCGGMLTAIDMRDDTFRLAPMPAGNYLLRVSVIEQALDVENASCVPEDTFSINIPLSVNVVNSTNDILNSRVEVYPNPASELVQISANRNIEKLRILDLSGRVLYQYFPDLPAYTWLIPDQKHQQMLILQVQLENGALLVRKLYVN